MRYPLRKVVTSVLMWEGNPHFAGQWPGNRTFRREYLECGHTGDFITRPAKRRRCDECGRAVLGRAQRI